MFNKVILLVTFFFSVWNLILIKNFSIGFSYEIERLYWELQGCNEDPKVVKERLDGYRSVDLMTKGWGYHRDRAEYEDL